MGSILSVKDNCIVIVRCSTLLYQLNATLFAGLCFFVFSSCNRPAELLSHPQAQDTIRIKSELSLNGSVAGFFVEENRTFMYLSSTVSNPRIEVYSLAGVPVDTIVLPQFPSTANPIRLSIISSDLIYFFIDPKLLVSYSPKTKLLNENSIPRLTEIMNDDSLQAFYPSMFSSFIDDSNLVLNVSYALRNEYSHVSIEAYNYIKRQLKFDYLSVYSLKDSNYYGLGSDLFENRLRDSLYAFNLPYYTISSPYVFGVSPFSKQVYRIALRPNATVEYWDVQSSLAILGEGWLSLKRNKYNAESVTDRLRNGASLFRIFPSDDNQFGLVFILHEWKYDPKGKRPWSIVRIDFETGEQREWDFSTSDLNPWSCQLYRDTLYISKYREGLDEDLMIHKYYAPDF